MRPFSSLSELSDEQPAFAPDPAGLFDGVLARGAVRAAVADRSWLAALIEVEAALARAQAAAGVIPTDAAHAIVAACAGLDVDIAELSADAARTGTPVLGLVERLRAALPDHFVHHVHKGATSQDIVDSASMLVARRATDPLLVDLRAVADETAALARRHRDTPMVGRTLLQQAVPTTFGLKAAGWMVALDEAAARLHVVRTTRLAVQFGGAAGTLAGLGGAGPQVARRLADELGLTDPVLPWHTNRTRPAELACALGEAAGVVAKVARDVTLLAQNEVGEVAEANPGGSSTMTHKRNPVAAISAAACAAQAPGLVATMLAAMAHEHERAAGSWHAEWRPLRELLVCTGSAAAWLRVCVANLEVRPEAMRTNLDRFRRELDTQSTDLGSAASLVDNALAVRE